MRERDPAGWEAWQPAEWPAPARVHAGHTLRSGGVSLGPWGDHAGGGGLNLGAHCGDNPASVAENRRRLAARLPGEPVWLEQVHGVRVHRAGSAGGTAAIAATDASVTDQAGVVLAVLSADCLPVLLSNREGTVVGAAHAGWRGLAGGVIEAMVTAARGLAAPAAQWLAWLGPAIGPQSFEVGDEVREAFVARSPRAAAAFEAGRAAGKWQADLFLLARQRLADLGIESVYGGERCTAGNPERSYSYRRDRITGRLASLVWIESAD
ncbi:MAG: peptidoglycan editing factor PgeF [Burkholderiaceae bacterium]|nr:peptidoglycan editing factor PgeF [Burkholderiaceae bacterium]